MGYVDTVKHWNDDLAIGDDKLLVIGYAPATKSMSQLRNTFSNPHKPPAEFNVSLTHESCLELKLPYGISKSKFVEQIEKNPTSSKY